MYNHAPENYLCPFCTLIGRIDQPGVDQPRIASTPDDVIYHDNAVTAFLSAHQWPLNPGNVLVVPNQHFENIYDLPVLFAADIHRLARLVALALKSVYACAGISTRQHNEPAGNQDVWHYHLHVTPRYQNDGFYTSQRELVPANIRALHAEEIKRRLAAYNKLWDAT